MHSTTLKFTALIFALILLLAIPIVFKLTSLNYNDVSAAIANLIPRRADTFPQGYEVGIWVWDTPQSLSSDEADALLAFLEQEKITTAYLRISDYIDIHESNDRAKREANFTEVLRSFVGKASKRGIEVHGLAGDPRWSNPSHRYIPAAILDYVGRYNASVAPEEKLAGMQFDIEPYAQDSFSDSSRQQEEILENYMEFMDRTLAQANRIDPGLRIGFTIPYWYDGKTRDIPKIEWNGTREYPVYHIMNELNKYPENYLVIMDYRSNPHGKNGSIALAENEMQYARSSAPNVHLIIGQIADDIKPENTTFYRANREELRGATSVIAERFKDNPTLKGFAIHQYKSYKDLKN